MSPRFLKNEPELYLISNFVLSIFKLAVATLSNSSVSNSIDSVISPILTEIVNEKGAKMLLERQSLLFADPKLDVSAEVIKKLNKRLPKIDVIVDQD